MACRAFAISSEDNVATLTGDLATPGEVTIDGAGSVRSVAAREAIRAGHKIALVAIPDGGAVIKYGIPIGRATCDIAPGQWVHLHNLRSEFDARSQTFDPHTGAATDTVYE